MTTTYYCPQCGRPVDSTACGACGFPGPPIVGDGSPDRPYVLRVDRGSPRLDVARIRGTVYGYFGGAAARDTSITSRDGETYRANVPNLGQGSTCYLIVWRGHQHANRAGVAQ